MENGKVFPHFLIHDQLKLVLMNNELLLDDPIRKTIKSILDITNSLVAFYKNNNQNDKALSLILFVITCLHKIIVKRQRLYDDKPFTPDQVKARYYLTKQKAKVINKNSFKIKNY